MVVSSLIVEHLDFAIQIGAPLVSDLWILNVRSHSVSWLCFLGTCLFHQNRPPLKTLSQDCLHTSIKSSVNLQGQAPLTSRNFYTDVLRLSRKYLRRLPDPISIFENLHKSPDWISVGLKAELSGFMLTPPERFVSGAAACHWSLPNIYSIAIFMAWRGVAIAIFAAFFSPEWLRLLLVRRRFKQTEDRRNKYCCKCCDNSSSFAPGRHDWIARNS